MKTISRHRLWLALAAVALAATAGLITVAPTGCASNCGSNCPVTTAIIATRMNVDPGILDLAWEGPACPARAANCRGDDVSTFCNHIDVPGAAEGYCDVKIALYGREPMAVRIQFGPRTTQGCCTGFPVIGDYFFTIPFPLDAGIYGTDGDMSAVRILSDGGLGDATGGGDDGSAADGGTD